MKRFLLVCMGLTLALTVAPAAAQRERGEGFTVNGSWTWNGWQ